MHIKMDEFDLIGAQEMVSKMKSPKELFAIWERLSYAYLRRDISTYTLDEMRASIWQQFRTLRHGKSNPKDRRGVLALV